MAYLNVTNIQFLGKNPDSFEAPFKFRLEFETFKPLPGKLEWKFVYFGDASN
jgi:hypothetical protein